MPGAYDRLDRVRPAGHQYTPRRYPPGVGIPRRSRCPPSPGPALTHALMEAPKGTIREVAVSDLTPHPDNYRAHPPEQVSRIAESLRRYGQRRAIVVQAGTMRVIAGNGVLAAAPEAGLETLICDVWPCDDETARAYLVEDNESVWGAEDDRTALAELLADLGDARPPSFPDDRVEDLLREVTMPRMVDLTADEDDTWRRRCEPTGKCLIVAVGRLAAAIDRDAGMELLKMIIEKWGDGEDAIREFAAWCCLHLGT